MFAEEVRYCCMLAEEVGYWCVIADQLGFCCVLDEEVGWLKSHSDRKILRHRVGEHSYFVGC